MLEVPAFVAGLDYVAVVSEAVGQRGGHLRVAEDGRPFAEGEVGRDDDRGSLVEPADEVEEQLAAGHSRSSLMRSADTPKDRPAPCRELARRLAQAREIAGHGARSRPSTRRSSQKCSEALGRVRPEAEIIGWLPADDKS